MLLSPITKLLEMTLFQLEELLKVVINLKEKEEKEKICSSQGPTLLLLLLSV